MAWVAVDKDGKEWIFSISLIEKTVIVVFINYMTLHIGVMDMSVNMVMKILESLCLKVLSRNL